MKIYLFIQRKKHINKLRECTTTQRKYMGATICTLRLYGMRAFLLIFQYYHTAILYYHYYIEQHISILPCQELLEEDKGIILHEELLVVECHFVLSQGKYYL